MSNRISNVGFRRCALILNVKGASPCDIRLKSGDRAVEPTAVEEIEGGFEVSFDLASAFSGRPIPKGDWVVEGVGCEAINPVCADFSGDGTLYTVKAVCGNSRLNLHIEYTPKKSSISEAVTDFALQLIYLTGRLLRFSRRRVIFTSESRASVSGNMEYVINAAKRLGVYGKIPIALSFYKGGSRGLFYAKTAFMLGQSSRVVIDDYYPLINHLRFARGTDIFQLWHACGAYKTFGYSRAGKKGAPRIDGNSHRCYTHVTVSSEAVRRHYAEGFGISVDKVYATGIPRTDVFFDSDYAAKQKAELIKQLPQAQEKKIVIFAPTFRGDGKHSAHYPINKLDLERLAELCRKCNRFMIFKMHPFVTDFRLPDGYEDVFADMQGTREVNDLLFSADLLITDYSSVIYEASLLDMNILLYAFDLEEYIASRDFYEPFDRYSAGKVVGDFDSLLRAIENENFEPEKRAAFRAYSMDSCDSHASERVAQMIFKD